MEFLKSETFFELSSFAHRDLFAGCDYVWQTFSRIPDYLKSSLDGNVEPVACFRRPLPETLVIWRGQVWRDGFEILDGDVTKGTFRVRVGGEETEHAAVLYAGSVLWDKEIQLGPGCVIEPGALVKGPTIIGAQTEIRQGAYIRGRCVIGKRCVVGHTTEMKSSIMLDGAKAGHFAYIGDSILGGLCNLGAGVKLANLKIKGDSIKIRIGEQIIDTGLRKFGAILGDGIEIGCNTVTNPGTLIGRGSMVFPVASVKAGYYGSKSVIL